MTEDTLGAGSHDTLLQVKTSPAAALADLPALRDRVRPGSRQAGRRCDRYLPERTHLPTLAQRQYCWPAPRSEACSVLSAMFPGFGVRALVSDRRDTARTLTPTGRHQPRGTLAWRRPRSRISTAESDTENAPVRRARARRDCTCKPGRRLRSPHLCCVAAARRRPLPLLTRSGTVLANTRRLEDAIGAAPVLAPVRGHLAYIETLANEARGDLRCEVVDQASQWAQYIGWLCTSGESYDEAGSWFSRSLEWAIEAEDDDLIATVWSFKGHLAWLTGKVIPTIGLYFARSRPDATGESMPAKPRISTRCKKFSEVNTKLTGLSVQVELHKSRGALDLASTIDPDTVPGVDRRTRMLVDLSRRAALANLLPFPVRCWNLERGLRARRTNPPGTHPKAVKRADGRARRAVTRAVLGQDWVKAYRRDAA